MFLFFAHIWCGAKSAFLETILSATRSFNLFLFTLPFAFAFYNPLRRAAMFVCNTATPFDGWMKLVIHCVFLRSILLEVWLSSSECLTISDVFTNVNRAGVLAIWHGFPRRFPWSSYFGFFPSNTFPRLSQELEYSSSTTHCTTIFHCSSITMYSPPA